MTPNGIGFGYERAGVFPEGTIHPSAGLVTVNSTAVDDYLDENRVAFAHVISIDAEGHDPWVLRGLSKSFAARRVGVVEFEVSGRKEITKWSAEHQVNMTLGPTVHWLHQLQYDCFWETPSGCVVPMSGRCWRPATFEKAEGNAVCALRHHYSRVFWSLAAECASCTGAQLMQKVSVARGAGR